MTTLVERTPAQLATDCRIRLRQPINRTGTVDGAWWPRSADLAAELPALLDVFWTAGRDMTRVVYNLETWGGAPRKLVLAGKQIHVSGYHYGNPLLMTVMNPWQTDSADLLVIPWDTSPETAERLLATAAESGSTLTAQQMLERGTP